MTARTLLLASLVFAGLLGSPDAVPVPSFYAFCRTHWLFALPCEQVANKLVNQIQAFNPLNGCLACHYTLESATNVTIKAHHSSLPAMQVENIEMRLQTTVLTGSCSVSAQSVSLAFTGILDNGLNYCNLHNLLRASGLNAAPGFMEMTSEWACLGYGFAKCKI